MNEDLLWELRGQNLDLTDIDEIQTRYENALKEKIDRKNVFMEKKAFEEAHQDISKDKDDLKYLTDSQVMDILREHQNEDGTFDL